MCFEFGCFGGATREDYGGERSSARKPSQGGARARARRGNRRNDEYNGGTGDHKAYHSQLHGATVDESGHKAYHDGARKDLHADAGGHGRYTAYVLDKVDYDTPKLPAWHNKVGADNGYSYTYTRVPRKTKQLLVLGGTRPWITITTQPPQLTLQQLSGGTTSS